MYKSPFDSLINTDSKFPFFNIYNYTKDKSRTIIEVSVAGFDKTELVVTEQDGYIYVSGKKASSTADKCYLVKGISEKSFSKTFYVGSSKVKSVKLANGILTFSLEEVVPDTGTTLKIED